MIGSLVYSGVFSRNIYQLGSQGDIVLPTYSDISLLVITLIVWCYCTFMEDYTPHIDTSKDRKEKEEKKKKFEEAYNK